MKILTLLYHDSYEGVDRDASGFPGAAPGRYKLEIGEMRRHFEAVSQRGYYQPSTILHFLDNPTRHPNPMFITFDDGGISSITQIAPILEEFGWAGHFFVTAGQIGSKSFLSGSQIRKLSARGHIIGSHSWSHPSRMSKCSTAELRFEWSESTKRLSDITGETVRSASVPGGFFSRAVAETAAEVGINALFTSEPTKRAFYIQDCLILGRFTLLEGMRPGVSGSLASGRFSPERSRQFIHWNAKKLAKRVLGERYLVLRRSILSKIRG